MAHPEGTRKQMLEPANSPSRETSNLEASLFSKEQELEEMATDMLNEDTEFNLRKTVNSAGDVVPLVEKVSGILSPYFIVLVGLFLYDRNALIGFILVAVGVLSLLKISWQDLQKMIERVKAFFTSPN